MIMKENDGFDYLEDDEGDVKIDFGQLFRDCKENRKRIIKITLAFFLFGVFIAFASPESYTSRCVFVPQFSQGLGSRFSSLASMASLDMDLLSTSESNINPKVYPGILEHPGFQLDLMHTKMHFEKADEPIELYDYVTEREYQKFNLLGTVKHYTIGLPGILKDALLPKTEVMQFTDSSSVLSAVEDESGMTAELRGARIYRMTEKEANVAKYILSSLDLDVNARKGLLTLTAKMPEANASAELCEAAFLGIKKYIGDFKRRKASDNLKFLDRQVEEAYEVYIRKQEECAKVMDSNMGHLTASAKIERIRKEADYRLANQMYLELLKQQVTARVKMEESTVAFTELSPAEIPLRRSSPRRTLLICGWTFFGALVSCAYVCYKSSRKRKNIES